MQEEKMKNKTISATNEAKKVFEDYPQVNCNECSCYWDSTCDGVPTNKERTCTAYKATRRTDLPKRVRKLENTVRKAEKDIVVLHVVIVMYMLFQFMSMRGCI